MDVPPVPSGLVTTKKLAEILDCTTKTVQNYVNELMPVAAVDPKGRRLFDLAVCIEWKRTHKPKSVTGGKREGAGRKPVSAPARLDAANTPAGAASSELATAKALVGQLEAMGVSSVAEILQSIDDPNLTPLKVKNGVALLEACLKRVELDKGLGESIAKGEVKTAWGQAAGHIKRQLDGMPARIAGQVLSLGVPPEKELIVRRMVQDEVDRICGILAKDPTGVSEAA